MAQNIFDATFDANNRIDVNSFDWSHVNNLTTDFGRITPVFCELVPAKGSLRINPEFGLELMPMVFPVQTRMFARLNFFKVTLRSMWEDYSDFISNFRDDLQEPVISLNPIRNMVKAAVMLWSMILKTAALPSSKQSTQNLLSRWNQIVTLLCSRLKKKCMPKNMKMSMTRFYAMVLLFSKSAVWFRL